MGKDREGRFHPKKGKPSGGPEGMDFDPSQDLDEVKQDLTNTQIRHPNRNTNKRQDYGREQTDRNDGASDKTTNDSYTEEFSKTVPQELEGRINKSLFLELAGYKGKYCLSVFLPTHKQGMEVNEQQDLIAFKNVLQEAEKRLHEKQVEEITIKRLLKPGYDLLRDDKFWYHLDQGLAFFIADDYFKYIRLPFTPPQEMILNTSFFVAPLAKALSLNEYFYLLVMSKKQVKFFRLDAFGIAQIHIDELPKGIDDVVHFEEKDDEKLFRMGGGAGRAGGGAQSANFHGIGSGKPDDKENITMYLDEVDETLWKEVLSTETAPLLLAGIEYMIPIYRSVTNYRYIWDEELAHGALEREDAGLLYKMAMEKMEPYFQQRLNNAKELYGNQSATELTVSAPADIIPAAFYGQISHLFVQEGAHVWGTFDDQNNKLQIHARQEEGDDCLVDRAVMKTIETNGEVFVLPPDKMPVQSVMAAVLRYSTTLV